MRDQIEGQEVKVFEDLPADYRNEDWNYDSAAVEAQGGSILHYLTGGQNTQYSTLIANVYSPTPTFREPEIAIVSPVPGEHPEYRPAVHGQPFKAY